jgi:hypothetical protein
LLIAAIAGLAIHLDLVFGCKHDPVFLHTGFTLKTRKY